MHPETGSRETVMTLKVGGLGWWHAAHILLSILTGGFWLVVYAIHAIIDVSGRPTMTVTVPEGGRVEYYRGHPHVLMPDEHLDKPGRRRAQIALVTATIVLIAGMAVVGMLVL